MATALVTGATGFVGSWVARTLLAAGHEVRILRRQSSRLDAIADLSLQHFIGDLTDPDVLEQALAGVQWVFHVAAVADYWRQNKEAIYRVNVDGTRLLLEASQKTGVRRFIFTSSAAAMGHREDGYPADEHTHFNINPRLTPYGHSKFLAEAEVYRAIQRGLDCVMLNPSVIIGPGDLNLISGSLVIEVAKSKVPVMPMQGGVTMIDVRDVARAHLAAAQRGHTSERYLLGSVNISHKAMLRLIAEIVGVQPPQIPIPPPLVDVAALLVDAGRALNIPIPGNAEGNQLRLSKRYIYFDCAKAWRELGEPHYDLTQSFADTYHWYRDHGYL